MLNPVRLFAGSFGGPTLWENPDFISPNEVRASERGRQGGKYSGRLVAQHQQVGGILELTLAKRTLLELIGPLWCPISSVCAAMRMPSHRTRFETHSRDFDASYFESLSMHRAESPIPISVQWMFVYRRFFTVCRYRTVLLVTCSCADRVADAEQVS